MELNPKTIRIVDEHAPSTRAKDVMVVWQLVRFAVDELMQREGTDPESMDGTFRRIAAAQAMCRLGVGMEELQEAEERQVAIKQQCQIEGM